MCSKRSPGVGKSAKCKDYLVVGNDGDACPTCGQPTIREHAAIAEKQLQQQCYYMRWFVCANPMCRTKRILPERYIVWNSHSRPGMSSGIYVIPIAHALSPSRCINPSSARQQS